MSWRESGRALGESAPDAGGCLVPELGGVREQVGVLPSASLQGSPGAGSDASLQPRHPATAAPLLWV